MSVDFFQGNCQTSSALKIFGLCDEPSPNTGPAYIDEVDGTKWIAVVENDYLEQVTFTAVDHCIPFPPKADGKEAKRCDGFLTFGDTIAFVELKERDEHGSEWVKKAEKQLLSAIHLFEKTDEAEEFPVKKAYIANSERPRFRESQARRMEDFFNSTGYTLRIEARIKIE
jgi:hypothetical protein